MSEGDKEKDMKRDHKDNETMNKQTEYQDGSDSPQNVETIPTDDPTTAKKNALTDFLIAHHKDSAFSSSAKTVEKKTPKQIEKEDEKHSHRSQIRLDENVYHTKKQSATKPDFSAPEDSASLKAKDKTNRERKGFLGRRRTSNSKDTRTEKTQPEEHSGSLLGRITEITSNAFHIARRTTDTSLKVGKVLMDSQDQLKLMLAAGETLRDLREVAGLTISDVSEALNLKDKSMLVAVENGTAALSFELILRLASLLARNDPIPFIIKLTRAYSPETWKILTDWGLGRIPLQYEREREFINIYRAHDEARKLSDEGFEKVLEFTRSAFEMSLHFISEQEGITESEKTIQENTKDKDKKGNKKEED